jgi:PHB/PHA accumulation regulator DNA-binding domain
VPVAAPVCAGPGVPAEASDRIYLEIGAGASQTAPMPDKHSARSDSVLIKRYAGRRLYDTMNSTYVTLDDLANMILAGERFTVRDAETGTDITRDILDRLH